MNSSWFSDQGFGALSPNSTFCSLAESSQSLAKQLPSKHAEGNQPTDALVDRRLGTSGGRTGLTDGLKQVHSAISALLCQQNSFSGKANAVNEQVDIYSRLLRSFNRSASSSSLLSVADAPCGSLNFSEIESIRAGCLRSVNIKHEQPQLSSLKSAPPSLVHSLSPTSSLTELPRPAFELSSSGGQPAPQVTLNLTKEQEQRLEALRTSFRSPEYSYLFEEPIASSSPNKSAGTQIRERSNEARLQRLAGVGTSDSRGIPSEVGTDRQTRSKMCRSIQVSPDKVDRAVATGLSLQQSTDSLSTAKGGIASPCPPDRRDASVQVSYKATAGHSASSFNGADEGFSEPTEMLSLSDRKDATVPRSKSPGPPACDEVRNVRVIANAEAKSEPRRVLALPQNEEKAISTQIFSSGFRLSSKMPFVAGTSTGSSYSVYARAQELLHSVKLNDPSLFEFCSKIKAPVSICEFMVGLAKHLVGEIDELCEDICSDLRIYDRIREEISESEDKDIKSDLLIRQKEIADRVVRTDFKVRRLQARLKAVRGEMRDLQRGKTYPALGRTAAANVPDAWRRPTLASSAKSSDRRSPTKQQRTSNSGVLRDLKAMKELITKHSYVRVLS